MRISPYGEIAWHHHAFLGQERVLDSRAPNLVVVFDPLLLRKLAHELCLLGALDVLVRRVMVRNENHARRIKDLVAYLTTHVDGNGRRNVVGMYDVHLALDELTWSDLVEPRVRRKDLLGDGHGPRH